MGKSAVPGGRVLAGQAVAPQSPLGRLQVTVEVAVGQAVQPQVTQVTVPGAAPHTRAGTCP